MQGGSKTGVEASVLASNLQVHAVLRPARSEGGKQPRPNTSW